MLNSLKSCVCQTCHSNAPYEPQQKIQTVQITETFNLSELIVRCIYYLVNFCISFVKSEAQQNIHLLIASFSTGKKFQIKILNRRKYY